LAPGQTELDRLLGLGQSRRKHRNPAAAELDDFVAWARRRPADPGVDVILFREAGGQSVEVHVKQAFFAIVRFLEEYSEIRAGLAVELDSLRPGEINQPDGAVLDAWIRHVEEHAADRSGDRTWSYAVLRNQMSPSMGGTLPSGGGNIRGTA
jgi:hypothetical protein